MKCLYNVFYVYLCKNKQVMYFKFEPLFCNFEVMQRIQTCKLVNGKARWPFFFLFFCF